MRVVLGYKFDSRQALSEFAESLGAGGVNLTSLISKNLKSSVEQYLFENRESVDAVVAMEHLESLSPYTIADFVRLTDIKDRLIIIPVIDDSHKGDEYVRQLYNEGIVNALFASDASIANIGKLLLCPREKKAARVYYGITSGGREEAGTDIARLLGYINDIHGEELIAKLEYYQKMLGSENFAVLMSRLPDGQKKELREQNLYSEYVGRLPEKKKLSISLPGISIPDIGREKAGTVFVNIGNEVFAVASLVKGAGSTFVSLNLAKEISEKTGLVPAYLHLPEGDTCYHDFGFDRIFGTSYYSHIQEAYDTGSVSEMRNAYQGVSFMCENPERDVLDGWKFENSLSVIYGAPNPTILDLGDTFDSKDNAALLPYCTGLIFVLDARADVEDVENVREFLKLQTKVKYKGIVFNRCDDEKYGYLKKYVGDACGSISVMEYSSKVLKGIFTYPSVSSGGIEKLIDFTSYGQYDKGTAKKEGKKHLFDSIFKKKAATGPVGTVEIAVAGLIRGVGTTYTALLLATAISRKYKVALLEQNDHGHFRNMADMMKKEIVIEGMRGFSLNGIDYFFDGTYKAFASSVKDHYDFVVIDYGVNGEFSFDDFLRAGVKILVCPSAKWDYFLIDEYYETVIQTYDQTHSFNFIVPFMTNKALSDIRKLLEGKHTVSPMPVAASPYDSSEEVTLMFGKMIGVEL